MKSEQTGPWSEEVPPPAFEEVPTMITRDEASYRAFFLAAVGDAQAATATLRETERRWPLRVPVSPFRDAAALVAYATGELPPPTARTRANRTYHALRARLPG